MAKEKYFYWRSDFYVEPGGVTPLWVGLEEQPLKRYQRWWLWTAMGAAVATGVGIGVGVYVDQATRFPDVSGGAHELNEVTP